MVGSNTNLYIFLTAGVITVLAVVGVTFLYPPPGHDEFSPAGERKIKIEALLPSLDDWVPRREEIERYPMGGPDHQ